MKVVTVIDTGISNYYMEENIEGQVNSLCRQRHFVLGFRVKG